ncbi:MULTISPECIES: YidB family protein [unclassified Rhizobium]|uniref:YidB family protein n=1 Tax=unclassified Rhizobium TaxID=2613769 RepID=UPI000A42ED04|nr:MULTISPECIES: YidB family protein [unclassified Rhizobium]
MSDRYPDTPDGRYFVVRGWLWRKSNPVLDEPTRNALVKDLTGGLGGLTGGGAGGLADLGGLLGGASSGSVLGGGPGDLVKQFQQNGQRETAKSWVETGPIPKLTIPSYRGLWVRTFSTICLQERVCRLKILSRLSSDLPKVVDELIPGGNIPPDDYETYDGGRQSVPSIKPQIV